MSEQPPDKPPLIGLEYETPKEPRPAIPYIGQMGIGFATFFAAGILALLIMGLGSANGSAVAGLLFGSTLAILILAVLATVARRNWRWRGFVPGVLIGLGVTVLAAGMCVAMFIG